MLRLLSLVFLTSALVSTQISVAASIEVPKENKEQGKTPAFQSFEAKAKLLLEAIEKNQSDLARSSFFPKEPFLALKAIAKPEAYYEQLSSWFDADIAKEHERIAGQEKLEFAAFEPGNCRWKKAGSEANSIPYWSCSKSKLKIKLGAKSETVVVHTLINWGSEWFITHLGPLPKSGGTAAPKSP